MKLILFVFALAVPAGNALALRPLVGEDAVLLGRDVRQAEGILDYSVNRSGPDRYATSATAELSYGLLDNLDVLVTVPWQGWSSKGLSESGLGDVLLEAKFLAARSAGWAFGLKPGFSLPAGSESKSLGAGKGGVWVSGLAGRSSGPWRFILNAGYLYNRNSFDERENILRGSAAAALALLPELLVTAQVSGQTNKDRGRLSPPLYALFGLSWSPAPALELDAGARLGLNGGSDDLGLLGAVTLRL